MNSGNCHERLERELADIPAGKVIVKKHRSDHETAFCPDMFRTDGKGKGVIEIFSLFPGIELFYNRFIADLVKHVHEPMKDLMQINHCRAGRIGWRMGKNNCIYLGAGDLSLHMADMCQRSEMDLPLGFYEGIEISLDIAELKQSSPDILREAGIDWIMLREKFCRGSKPTAMPASEKIEHIFSELYDLPERLRVPYYKLKVQELLLFLSMADPPEGNEPGGQDQSRTEIIKEIHALITANMDKRYTIDELAKRYLLNTTTLKAGFKAMYGLPIASYMKQYRIKQAMRLLRETDESISEIAGRVGYESRSKFTKAFKDSAEILPTEYRSLYRG